MWEYGEPVEPNNQQKLNCKLCGKEMTRRISQLKYHLAQVLRHKVEICPNSTPEIIHIANQSLLDMGKKKDESETVRLELATGGVARSKAVRSESFSSASPSTMPSTTSPFFVSENYCRCTTFY
jgi:hypothetical protein